NRLFGQYSELLEKKHEKRSELFRRPNFFSFQTQDGGVFLRCLGNECLMLEGGDRPLFVELNKQLNWGAFPEPDQRPGTSSTKTATIPSVAAALSGAR